MSTVLEFLIQYKYWAMFGILFLCGLGLPLPEEVTLVGSGLLVGWDQASFAWSSVACVLGILVGDSMIFGLGYAYGRRFLFSRPMRWILPRRRQKKVGKFFAKHGSKAVFFARFFAGVRLGVYAYAGSQRMAWTRFLLLDLMGALISGPTSIWVGAWAARKFAGDAEEAQTKALSLVRESGHWVIGAVAVGVLLYIVFLRTRRRARRDGSSSEEALRPPVEREPPSSGIDRR